MYCRALQDNKFTLKKNKCLGGKFPKERFTISNCANMPRENDERLVTGKVSYFKTININNLPVICKYKKALMTKLPDHDWEIHKEKNIL